MTCRQCSCFKQTAVFPVATTPGGDIDCAESLAIRVGPQSVTNSNRAQLVGRHDSASAGHQRLVDYIHLAH